MGFHESMRASTSQHMCPHIQTTTTTTTTTPWVRTHLQHRMRLESLAHNTLRWWDGGLWPESHVAGC